MPNAPLDSPRPGLGNLSDVPEEYSLPNTTFSGASTVSLAGSNVPSASGSRQTYYTSSQPPAFRTQQSSSSLASVASAAASVGSITPSTASNRPSLAKNLPGLRAPSSTSLRGERDRAVSDTASATGVSVAGIMATSTIAGGKGKGRSKSPSATIREKDASSSIGKDGHAVASRRPAPQTGPRYRQNPHLPGGNAEPVPATLMYWSKAPVYGSLPSHGLRAHSVTLVDGIAWIFGGCDDKGCWKDVWCFNTGEWIVYATIQCELNEGSSETMQWSNPSTLGDIPPPCRAHTATLVDRRIVMFGGGESSRYYNDVYVLDTVTRTWSHPEFPEPPEDSVAPPTIPPRRRAHTAVLYRGRIWIFGGGNGTQALNDLWTLEVGNNASVERMKWEQIETKGKKPSTRGYHTANLVGNVMIVMGGSDGKECFSDIWCLNLGRSIQVTRDSSSVTSFATTDTLQWSQVKLQTAYRRLSHSATQVGSYLFIFGGHNGTSYSSDLLLFNLGMLSTLSYTSLETLIHPSLVALNFESRPPAGRPPSARGYHAALLTDSRLFVFGGFNAQDVFDDVHLLDLAGAAYLPQVTSFKIDVD